MKVRLKTTNVIVDIKFNNLDDAEQNALLSILYKKILNVNETPSIDDLEDLALTKFRINSLLKEETKARLFNSRRHIKIGKTRLQINPLRLFGVELQNFKAIIEIFKKIKNDLKLHDIEYSLRTINFICKDDWTKTIYELLAHKFGEYIVFSNSNLKFPSEYPNFTFFKDYLSIWIRIDFKKLDLTIDIAEQLKDKIMKKFELTFYSYTNLLNQQIEEKNIVFDKLEVFEIA